MRRVVAAATFLLASGIALAQADLSAQSPKPKQYISYSALEQTVKAGKKSVVELTFKVADGYHVNSHTPKSELLIPTNLTMKPAAGVTAAAPEYPVGTSYSFSFEPNEKLDVYTGTFIVKVPVAASVGTHTVEGTLHYQACDNAACYPPKTLPVAVTVTAK